MILLKGTDDQITQMFLKAINNSNPLGMGFLHYEDKKYTNKDLRYYNNIPHLEADYFHGRMVKTSFIKQEEGVWKKMRGPDIPNPEYQGWSTTYPTYEDLAQGTGVIIEHKND